MNGIKLKSNDLHPLKVERIKWIILVVISHVFSIILMSSQEGPIQKMTPKEKVGFVRLQLPLISQVSLNKERTPVILMTENQVIVTREAEIIKRISLREGIESSGVQYLIDLPEKDMERLVRLKNKRLLAYPATKLFRPKKKKRAKESYEIHF